MRLVQRARALEGLLSEGQRYEEGADDRGKSRTGGQYSSQYFIGGWIGFRLVGILSLLLLLLLVTQIMLSGSSIPGLPIMCARTGPVFF